MRRSDYDLLLVVLASLAVVVIVLAFPSAAVARVALGAPFVLLFPGYVLVAALFPHKDDLSLVERAALSLGLSIAVVALIGLALNYSPWGIRLETVVAFVTLFVVLSAAAALYRKRVLSAEEAFGIDIAVRLPPRSRAVSVDRLLAGALVLSLAGLAAAAYFVADSRGGSEAFTEFYVLGPAGRAEGYPTSVALGQDATVILGVVNKEGRDTAYRLALRIDGEDAASIDSVRLADGERWEKTMAILPVRAGDDQKVEFLLFKDGGREPYSSLHLRLDVDDAPSGRGSSGEPASLPRSQR